MTLVGYWMNYILFLACDSCYPDDDGKDLPDSFGNTQVLYLVSVLASGAAAAAEVEPFVGIDVLHHMALVDFDSDCFVAGGTAAILILKITYTILIIVVDDHTPELGTASINPGCGGTLCEIKGCPVGKPRTPLELVVTLTDAFNAA
ncbi:hypothetical protein pdam_00014723 [Pocillopora damicornis]|uniref:Uncharacterized protein n=1 Tax=Pocillopora damicornis TaxID=46731 RepID=A0A3M6U3L7_POCDA|nr:hypothetical protein pdam_00014723 [Pocillopora damicornis]